jgi:pimeloyl-ACP methyl ester carboxylesterase
MSGQNANGPHTSGDSKQAYSTVECARDTKAEPVLLTLGDQSPPIFAPVVAKLTEALPRVEVLTFPGAGHNPHVTAPDAYVETIIAFTRKHRPDHAGGET